MSAEPAAFKWFWEIILLIWGALIGLASWLRTDVSKIYDKLSAQNKAMDVRVRQLEATQRDQKYILDRLAEHSRFIGKLQSDSHDVLTTQSVILSKLENIIERQNELSKTLLGHIEEERLRENWHK